MMSATKKNCQNIDIGVLNNIDEVDRSLGDPPNLIAVVTDIKNGAYQVGTAGGIIKSWFNRPDIEKSTSNFNTVNQCENERLGKLSKYQAEFLSLFFNIEDSTTEEQYAMAVLALGNKANPPEFYAPLLQNKNLLKINHEQFSSSIGVIDKCLLKLKNIRTQDTFLAVVLGNAMDAIRVQPTTVARRNPGVTRGSKRMPTGRPASNVVIKREKRKHNLTSNVLNNVPHAKGHGSGH
ncbi:unnamed protein product [Psylliodes chrysocephalus]|uniref:Uncharacterized protein n=1 Tax=Psylliodes chrysocephalus TaxID=3402493 RepID=A0A9P0D3U8_9CUCU|nr:unnamed protein product [Psylliodes chrysocephala]